MAQSKYERARKKSWRECWLISFICLAGGIILACSDKPGAASDAGYLIGAAIMLPALKWYFEQ